MYDQVKTHKNNNPLQIIVSQCNTAVENLSVFVEDMLYTLADALPSKIGDTGHMLYIVDNISSLMIFFACRF